MEEIMSDKKAVIKLTKTMLNKCIIDANASVREFVKTQDVFFDDMLSGSWHVFQAEFKDGTRTFIKCYRTKNARADRRISIKRIKAQANVGDTVTFTLKGDRVILEVSSE
jgi:hypothetical protein|tara:strand:- start:60 stop:389 length:330 start_codon:yes stop_codon:yes gene_type:complete